MRLTLPRTREGWARAVVVAALAGCAHSPPPEPLAPKSELVGLRLLLDPKVELPLVTDACVPYQKAWSGALRQNVRMNLAKVGFEVTDDPRAPRDAVARVGLVVSRCAGLVDVGEMQLAVLPDFPVTVDLEASKGPQPMDAENLVRKLIALPKVLALKHRLAPTASAAAASQTVPPAATSAPVAPGASPPGRP
jgi:hypothetical protein